MRQLKRLHIKRERINADDGTINLDQEEKHYLTKVLRLKTDSRIAVIDGLGSLWEANLVSKEQIRLIQDIDTPMQKEDPPITKIGIAVVNVRRGMDEIVRMCSEIGVNKIQLLSSEWQVKHAEDKPKRWEMIIKEATEQCERLWPTQLCQQIEAKDWWEIPDDECVKIIASSRGEDRKNLNDILSQHRKSRKFQPKWIWVAIGPEGGWTTNEENDAIRHGWKKLSIGNTILRTSTAAVVASSMLCQCRDNSLEINISRSE